MRRYLPLLLFIGLIYLSCEDKKNEADPCADCGMEITSDLPLVGGVYQLTYNPGQTYQTLYAETDCGWAKNIGWASDYMYQLMGQWVMLVNPGSMTDENGDAQVIFTVWEDFIGTTITIYGGYTDECEVHHVDSIKVKVVN